MTLLEHFNTLYPLVKDTGISKSHENAAVITAKPTTRRTV